MPFGCAEYQLSSPPPSCCGQCFLFACSFFCNQGNILQKAFQLGMRPQWCFVFLLGSADEHLGKRALRCASFSEIIWSSLIAWGHLKHSDTLTNNGCFEASAHRLPCAVCYVLIGHACPCCLSLFLFPMLRIDTVYWTTCAREHICAIACDIVSAKQNNHLRFFNCWFLSLSACQPPWCAWSILCKGWM